MSVQGSIPIVSVLFWEFLDYAYACCTRFSSIVSNGSEAITDT